jgi:hypothetical protein
MFHFTVPQHSASHPLNPQLPNRSYARICQNVNDTLYIYYGQHTLINKVPAADSACICYALGTESGKKEN